MKVNGTGAGLPTVDAESMQAAETAAAGNEKTEGTAPARGTAEGGAETAAVTAGAQGSRAPEMSQLVADISADLKAGRIGADAAVDKVVSLIVERQVPAATSPALREQVQAALRATLQNDPFVGAQIGALRRRSE